jgi:hypothetical protein
LVAKTDNTCKPPKPEIPKRGKIIDQKAPTIIPFAVAAEAALFFVYNN